MGYYEIERGEEFLILRTPLYSNSPRETNKRGDNVLATAEKAHKPKNLCNELVLGNLRHFWLLYFLSYLQLDEAAYLSDSVCLSPESRLSATTALTHRRCQIHLQL